MSQPSRQLNPSLESSSSVGEPVLRHSLFDTKEDFIGRVAHMGMAAIYFGSFTLAPQDAALARQALYKLSFVHRHFLQPAGLRIAVHHQTALLSGEVTRAGIVAMAEILAHQIEGIIQVTDETEVPHPGPSEAEKVRESIQLLFAIDQTLRSSVQVHLREKRVTLEGKVGSEAQKSWAEQLAQAVTGEIDSQIKIADVTSCTFAETDKAIAVDDESLQALVLLRLRLVRETENLPVKVKASRGILTLQGKVRTEPLRQRAENIARSTLGLGELRSTLLVAP